jgi:uncharacterized RDD family membrane protein YckC
MKCPKCGYLGFETTDRCRNCQYDFSLAPFVAEQELTLHDSDRKIESPDDLELPMARQTITPSTALDLDRMFGEPAPAPASSPAVERVLASAARITAEPDTETELGRFAPDVLRQSGGHTATEHESAGLAGFSEAADASVAPEDEGALPFDDAPIMTPPAARAPLAVRRATPELPRNRPRAVRPRPAPLDFEPTEAKSAGPSRAASETVALLMEAPSLGMRVGAGVIDVLLLAGIDAAVLYLTLRITGLENTVADLRILPVIPFVGFLGVLGFGYLAAFTVAGGQTIGKMILSLRVIGDDGRPVDAAGGMLRALACMLVPITLGLSYLPALFTSDHRALHDRLAGTRVVQE